MPATCPTCQTQFEPKRPWQRFDKPACRRAYHRGGTGSDHEHRIAELERRVAELEKRRP